MDIVMLALNDITPYEKNTRRHRDFDVMNIAKSIEKYGFNDPIGVWGKRNTVVEGHGRLLAAKLLGLSEVPCVRLDHLTDKERREYAVAHNATAELSAWDTDALFEELSDLDLHDFDFDFDLDDLKNVSNDLENEHEPDFETKMREGKARQTSNEEYEAFVEKFDIPKTTDDCFTPPEVYSEVLKWATKEYGLEGRKILRPFYPGGDYEKEDYPAESVVLDNPPFSILSQIIKFYNNRKINFFLFAPALTMFSNGKQGVTFIAAGLQIEYENGASVNTGFVTNMGGKLIRTAPELYSAVDAAQKKARKEKTAELPKYKYPANVITSAMVNYLSKHGQNWSTNNGYCISELDAQREQGKTIFGNGFLVGDKAAREAEAARREAEAARRVDYILSDRELQIVAQLTKEEA